MLNQKTMVFIYEGLELGLPLDSQEYCFHDPMPLPASISIF